MKTKIEKKLKNLKYDKIQILTELKLWQNSYTYILVT